MSRVALLSLPFPALRSVRGLSLTSFSSELFCYMVSVAYNVKHGYAFSTFGDTGVWPGAGSGTYGCITCQIQTQGPGAQSMPRGTIPFTEHTPPALPAGAWAKATCKPLPHTLPCSHLRASECRHHWPHIPAGHRGPQHAASSHCSSGRCWLVAVWRRLPTCAADCAADRVGGAAGTGRPPAAGEGREMGEMCVGLQMEWVKTCVGLQTSTSASINVPASAALAARHHSMPQQSAQQRSPLLPAHHCPPIISHRSHAPRSCSTCVAATAGSCRWARARCRLWATWPACTPRPRWSRTRSYWAARRCRQDV